METPIYVYIYIYPGVIKQWQCKIPYGWSHGGINGKIIFTYSVFSGMSTKFQG